jgi:hypothetical protein
MSRQACGVGTNGSGGGGSGLSGGCGGSTGSGMARLLDRQALFSSRQRWAVMFGSIIGPVEAIEVPNVTGLGRSNIIRLSRR